MATKTIVTYTLDGTRTDFDVPFDYLARKFVVVTLIGADRRVLVQTTDYRFATKSQISTTIAHGSGDGYTTIEIRRFTSASERLVDFADGSILRAFDLNVAQLQTIHIAEEARDLTADTIGVNADGNLDARGRRIVNLADGIADGDATNLAQTLRLLGSSGGGGSATPGADLRLPVSQAKTFPLYLEGQRVFITDLGFYYRFTSSRVIITGYPDSTVVVDDEVHKLVAAGGMLVFDEFSRLPELESRNYGKYLAKVRSNQAIQMVSYGDSITYGYRPDGGQYPKPYPKIVAETMTIRTQSTWTELNKGNPSDRSITNYIRTMGDGTTGDISTIMLGVNDVLFGTNNGANPEEISTSVHSVENYVRIMRLFVARELLRGRCVVLLGTTQFVSLNNGPLGGFTAPYLARAYDAAAKQLAGETTCMFVDTKRDVTQQYGISESCHDGLHLREDFLVIFGRRLANVFLHVDYKNPFVLRPGGVFIPNYLHNPIVSNRPLVISAFTGGSSPPIGGGLADLHAAGVMIPNVMTSENSLTLSFYLDADNAVIYPTINATGTDYSFNMILDNGARQPYYASDIDIIPVLRDPTYIVSGKAISGSDKKNRQTENYSQLNAACYFHITTRGWHSISFVTGANSGIASVEGLLCEDWISVKNNDVYGGLTGTLEVKSDGSHTATGRVLGVTNPSTGVYDVQIAALSPNVYEVTPEASQDSAPLTMRVLYKTNSQFRVEFWGAGDVKVAPTEFTLRVHGGR
ncbi:tail spike protein [Pectobacterium phage Q19]|uniref:Tail spike protein n=1 Tax=Pectobacterium phage Q19 TaxID=2500576 RepID=A0A679A2X0_9CAUD|nr:tail spike protein [Pectobacterium phage Q19]